VRIYVPMTQELLDDAMRQSLWVELQREVAWALRRDRPAITWTFEPFPRLTAAWRWLRRR